MTGKLIFFDTRRFPWGNPRIGGLRGHYLRPAPRKIRAHRLFILVWVKPWRQPAAWAAQESDYGQWAARIEAGASVRACLWHVLLGVVAAMGGAAYLR